MKLTPNQRMAIFLQKETKGEVLPIKVWVEGLYAQLRATDPEIWPYCLSVNEEEVIWEDIIQNSSIEQPLFRATDLARLAREAWNLSLQWRLPNKEDAYISDDSCAFLEWKNAYLVRCQEKAWIDQATLMNQLIEAVVQNKISLPSQITLVGFEELSPQEEFFFKVLRENGIVVRSEALVSKRGKLSRIAAADPEAEIRLAAAMANHWLKEDPDATIGIVVPLLTQNRSLVVRVLQETLPARSFNVAAPLPLIRYPLIAAALSFLDVLTGERALEEWSQFLCSPFWGGAESEKFMRNVMDVKIRHLLDPQFSLVDFIKKIEYVLKKNPKISCEDALQRLKNMQLEGLELTQKHSTDEWIILLTRWFEILGWPGERILSSEEYQVKQQWDKLLVEYQLMGPILERHSYWAALKEIKRLAVNTVFLPASFGGSVKVLGMLEAIGLPFDYLWVTGLYREAWPQEPAPNPFIPRSLQKAHGLPRSSAERELKMAKRFTEKLCQGGREVVFSYPIHLEVGESVVSSLIEFIPEVSLNDLNVPLDDADQNSISDPSQLQAAFIPNYLEMAPPLSETERILGGTRVLKLQALCPFRAFAESRLQAYPIPTHILGLSPAERGEMIHEVLAIVWKEIHSQRVLQALSFEDQSRIIKNAVGSVFQAWSQKRPRTLTPEYLTLEKNRTFEFVFRLLELEKTRPAFTVKSVEEHRVLELKGLTISIRIDRIDEDLKGQEILIDYKTGKTSLSEWFGNRLRDPQLPLYGVTRDPLPSAIAFLMVRPDGIKFQGLAAEKDLLPGVKTVEQLQWLGAEQSFEEQCAVWLNSLEQLAENFSLGIATVDPVDGKTTCRTCTLKPLCRIDFG